MNLCLHVYVCVWQYMYPERDALKCWVVIFFLLLIYIFYNIYNENTYLMGKKMPRDTNLTSFSLFVDSLHFFLRFIPSLTLEATPFPGTQKNWV